MFEFEDIIHVNLVNNIIMPYKWLFFFIIKVFF